ncbi:MAG: amino acid ABC transporter permease [Pseudomonadota bacterium]|nr:amino acid ABC transporter permease [Pseudomonadota bacterium]
MGYDWHWRVFLEPAPGHERYLDWVFSGLKITLTLGLSAWVIALVLGAVLGVMRTLPNKALATLAAAYVELFRNVPLIVQLFIWYFVAPELQPFGDAIKKIDPVAQQYLAAMLCLGTYTAARICEQVRGGILSLPRGQRLASQALGLTLAQTYRHVLLPMALRIIVPPLTSEFLNIFKNSAVASTVGLLDLAAQGRQLVDYTSRPYESFIAITVMYIGVNAVVMLLMRVVETRARVPGYIGA